MEIFKFRLLTEVDKLYGFLKTTNSDLVTGSMHMKGDVEQIQAPTHPPHRRQGSYQRKTIRGTERQRGVETGISAVVLFFCLVGSDFVIASVTR